ncbi:MAG: hypothetical protein M5U28_01950 [Sandaracinaceae bacterium]|nr:hypothetical protein [Sandaracinaceae bacterium]
MGARYLYGDSHPFPDGYDFLQDLRRFVGAASRALAITHEADELERSLGERAAEHLHATEAIGAFFDTVAHAVGDRAARSGAPKVIEPYARELLATIDAMGNRARASLAQNLDADQVGVTTRIRERRAELKQVLSEYLLTDPLPTLSWAMSLQLTGSAPQGQLVVSHPGDLTTSFAIDVTGDPTWGRPRKIGELVEGLTLQVGWKKAFLRSSLHPDVVTLDDLVLGAVELGPTPWRCACAARRTPRRDSYVLTTDLDDTGVPVAKVTRIDERGGDSDAPFVSQADDAARPRSWPRPCAARVRRSPRASAGSSTRSSTATTSSSAASCPRSSRASRSASRPSPPRCRATRRTRTSSASSSRARAAAARSST